MRDPLCQTRRISGIPLSYLFFSASKRRCERLLSCDHQCPSVCGEDCPSSAYCRECGGSGAEMDQVVDMLEFTTCATTIFGNALRIQGFLVLCDGRETDTMIAVVGPGLEYFPLVLGRTVQYRTRTYPLNLTISVLFTKPVSSGTGNDQLYTFEHCALRRQTMHHLACSRNRSHLL